MSLFTRGGGNNPFSLIKFIYYLPDFIKLYWRLFRDGRMPGYLKIMLAGALVYFISPVDLIPELINPLLGITDDLVVITLALKYFIKLAPKKLVDEHIKRIELEG